MEFEKIQTKGQFLLDENEIAWESKSQELENIRLENQNKITKLMDEKDSSILDLNFLDNKLVKSGGIHNRYDLDMAVLTLLKDGTASTKQAFTEVCMTHREGGFNEALYDRLDDYVNREFIAVHPKGKNHLFLVTPMALAMSNVWGLYFFKTDKEVEEMLREKLPSEKKKQSNENDEIPPAAKRLHND